MKRKKTKSSQDSSAKKTSLDNEECETLLRYLHDEKKSKSLKISDIQAEYQLSHIKKKLKKTTK